MDNSFSYLEMSGNLMGTAECDLGFNGLSPLMGTAECDLGFNGLSPLMGTGECNLGFNGLSHVFSASQTPLVPPTLHPVTERTLPTVGARLVTSVGSGT